MREKTHSNWSLILAAWVITLSGILGSLFFSEFMKFPPCALCWYQRIALYPLGILLAIGFVDRDPRVVRYSLPFVVVGLAVAVYHNLVYYHVIPESLSPCTQGVPCTTVQIEWLGFVTIPFLSLGAFATLLVCLGGFQKGRTGIKHE